MIAKIIFNITILLFISDSIYAQAQFDSLTNTGIKQIYSLEFKKAEATFNKVQYDFPKKPAGKFFDAMIVWWKIMLNMNDEEYDDILIDKLDNVIDFCDDLLDENENNFDAQFFKGGALGFKGRLNSLREEWFNAALNGKEALPLVYKSYEIDSTNADVQLGFGIYNYYAAVIPEKYPFVKPLMLFFPKGDKKKGLKQLIYAADKSKYAKYEARFFLINIYYKFEENYNQALFYVNQLQKEFPNNSVVEKYKGRILIKSGKTESAVKVYQSILRKNKLGLTGYNNPLKREALYYVGLNYYTKNIPDSALVFFSDCYTLSKKLDGEKETGFRINALLYKAECNKKLGRLNIALKDFNNVLELDDFRNSHKKAQEYIDGINSK